MSANSKTATPHAETPPAAPYRTPARLRNVALGLVIVGAGLFAWTLSSQPWRAWANGLIASYLFVSIAIGATVLVALTHVAKAGWAVVLRRIPEAIGGWLPFGLVALLAVTGLGMHELYEWSHPDIVAQDELLQHKAVLMTPNFFLVRLVVILGLWSLFAWVLRRNSVAQDKDGDDRHTRANVAWSAIFLIMFGLTMTIASLDWLMSLEPHWFSTIFGVYQFAGAFVAGCATVTLAVLGLRRAGYLPQVTTGHLHDLGKLMFAFSTFWAYIWISQFLLIWYANMPEETGYFLMRREGAWLALFASNVVLNWLIPFLTLIPRPNKRSPKILAIVASLLLVGHWLDVYLQVMPPVSHLAVEYGGDVHAHGPFLGLQELGPVALMAGLFLLVVSWRLGRAALVPQRDPYLVESVHHQQ
ncbi:MAG: hypothetical protein ACOYOB_10295 [Myxococcota bacterium]